MYYLYDVNAVGGVDRLKQQDFGCKRVYAAAGLEWSAFSCGMVGIVTTEFGKRWIIEPFVMVLVYEEAKDVLKSAVRAFGLAVRLGVI